MTISTLEDENIRIKMQFKEQLVSYSGSVQELQKQLEDRERLIRESQAQNFELRTQNDSLRDKMTIVEN